MRGGNMMNEEGGGEWREKGRRIGAWVESEAKETRSGGG